MSIRVVLLADHPEVLPALAAAYERESPQWYGVHGDAMTDLRERSRRNGFPIGLIALESGQAVGSLALTERSLPSHANLSPWVVGFWVEPSRRNQGIGARVLKAAAVYARGAGVECLYAATAAASPLFVREGWSKIDVGMTEGGHKVNIFALTLS